MIPRFQRKTIGELQYEYLAQLLECNKDMTVSQAIYRMSVLNQYTAWLYINLRS